MSFIVFNAIITWYSNMIGVVIFGLQVTANYLFKFLFVIRVLVYYYIKNCAVKNCQYSPIGGMGEY